MLKRPRKHPNKSLSAEARRILANLKPTRQMRRKSARRKYFAEWICDQRTSPIGPADSRGIIPRRVRRSIAHELARKNWRAL